MPRGSIPKLAGAKRAEAIFAQAFAAAAYDLALGSGADWNIRSRDVTDVIAW